MRPRVAEPDHVDLRKVGGKPQRDAAPPAAEVKDAQLLPAPLDLGTLRVHFEHGRLGVVQPSEGLLDGHVGGVRVERAAVLAVLPEDEVVEAGVYFVVLLVRLRRLLCDRPRLQISNESPQMPF